MSCLRILNQSKFTQCEKVEDFLDVYSTVYELSSNKLKEKSCVRVTKSRPCLYIQQQEFGVISKDDSVLREIGTDRATTCHIVIMQTKDKKLTALGHFDGACTIQGMDNMIAELIYDGCNKLEVHVIGGFEDSRDMSSKLSEEIINALCTYDIRHPSNKITFDLHTFCCTNLNTFERKTNDAVEKFPVILGVVCNTTTGEIVPAVFDDEANGPVQALRGAKLHSDQHCMKNIYDRVKQCVSIEYFSYVPMPDALRWASQPDHIIRKYLSTSPNAEPDNFEFHTRQTLLFLHNYPNSELIFNGRPRLCFKPRKNAEDIIEYVVVE